MVPTVLISSGRGSSTVALRWVDRNSFLSVASARSTASSDGRRPTTNGTIVCGKTTMSRRGTMGSRLTLFVRTLVAFFHVEDSCDLSPARSAWERSRARRLAGLLHDGQRVALD